MPAVTLQRQVDGLDEPISLVRCLTSGLLTFILKDFCINAFAGNLLCHSEGFLPNPDRMMNAYWHICNCKPYRETTPSHTPWSYCLRHPTRGCALKKKTINNLKIKSSKPEELFIPLKCKDPFTSTTPALPQHAPAQLCLHASYSGVIGSGVTQQEKRPVHCETCYSLSYSVTAPLPAAHRCEELVPMGINHMNHLRHSPQVQGEQKVLEHGWPLLYHYKPVHCVQSYKCLGALRDEGQTAMVSLNMQCDCSHQFPPGSLCLSRGAQILRPWPCMQDSSGGECSLHSSTPQYLQAKHFSICEFSLYFQK